VIHTNGIAEHAERVLHALGVAHHFDAIYDIRFNDYVPKPCKETLTMLLKRENASPDRSIIVDDMADNLAVAHELGARTAWVSPQKEKAAWDYHIASVHELPGCLAGRTN
jgi:putative hydrolase of the HAD superfamily